MTNAVGGNAIRARGARAFLGSRILLLILALILAPAPAAARAARDVPKGNPRLAGLQIEIWPEFDRLAAALVILKGEIAAGVPLPAAVNLRIAARSDGACALAPVRPIAFRTVSNEPQIRQSMMTMLHFRTTDVIPKGMFAAGRGGSDSRMTVPASGNRT
ncbi:MAG TPA: hypothetical protein VMV87_01035 [Burkholderiales bacterium]|nr:hypothetical protein [Burkholderiales bacterium]